MKKIVLFILIGVSLASILVPAATFAHELLPKEITEYVKNNPNASPEQIQQYVETNTPEYSEKFKSSQNVLKLAKQETNFFDNFFDFVKLGVNHILSGLDHIFFVLSLLLVFIGLAHVFRYTLTFTLAHSFTLILAGTGALTLSSRVVEPVIALSIAVMALVTVFFRDNKYLKTTKYKLAIIFFFGLFHGLGFAGLLQEIQVPEDKFVSSLFAFNVGIEIGQLVIIGLALPFIYLLRNKPWYPLLIKVIAVTISAVAVFWMLQRILA